ncbi:Norsolorinic acid ketoreductase [Madurella mycetomatis]|uniref:Norsolorinic acid ketoreductase n=1 Tax=Madurella mycetomatis TaxID=100816 RepID=A0A175VZ53_9PEZI|nr:Norsolorinic acid ketoreductase [Madurella mycetomatis]KXX80982.1 Norsolorinic acid ketoreductase [Madurella mycetomatis]
MAPTTILITGGNRGLGLGLVGKFLSQPNHTVIAANRDPSHPTSQALADLPKGDGSKLIVVKYDASVERSAFDAVKQAQGQGIAHLDIVVANAAIVKHYPLAKDAQRSELLEHFKVNVLGPLELYQATRDLLQKSPGKPNLVLMGSGAGALGRQPPVPNALYGSSKATVAWFGVRINAEDEWLNTFVLDPGWVQTEMGNEAARLFGVPQAPTTKEDSVEGLYNVITTATKEKYGGKVVLYTGEVQVY